MTTRTFTRLVAAGLMATFAAAAIQFSPAEAITSGHIRGQVTVPRGISTYGLEVEALQLVNGKWRNISQPAPVKSNGSFDLGRLRTGTFRIYVGDPNGRVVGEWYDNTRTFTKAASLKVRAGHVTKVDRIHLSRAAHIRGRLQTSSGALITRKVSAEVYALTGTEWTFVRNEYPNSKGVYDVGGLRAGSYRVGFRSDDLRYVEEYFPNASSVESASTITLKAGEVVRGRNAVLVTASRIRGVVTKGDGLPLPGAVVTPMQLVDGQWKPMWQRQANARADGSYEVRGLASGTYRLRFWTLDGDYAEEFWDDASAVSRATDVVVPTAGVVSGKNAELVHIAYVSGKVSGTASERLGGIIVTAHRPVPGAPGTWEVARTAVTTVPPSSGSPSFQMKLAPGTYRFTFEDPSGKYVNRTLDDAPDRVIDPSGGSSYGASLVERPAG